MTTIRFERITKAFGTTEVIKSLDLEISSGEFFTFVGPSGCGKSTLLHMIAGLDAPSSGLILFDGKPVNDLSPQARDIALVFQNYALYPHLTAFENIAFPLRMKKAARNVIEDEVNRVAGLLGISASLGKKPKELSGGQRQRVALGRAIVRRPKVFLMDEPLSNLDARLRLEMRTELLRLHRELGITTVYVTHDQSEAMSLSDRVAVLNRGELQQCDRPLAVYRRPANVFVAGFIGVPAMNLFPARVTGKRPLAVAWAGITLSPPAEHFPPAEDVLIGMRPEDVIAGRSPDPAALEMTVELAEPSGPITWLELAGRGLKLAALSRPEEELVPGDRCYVKIMPEKIALFDPSSGRRL
ncbi:MAG: hypothetical protein A2010_13305 [Nitrospirae bacterium GWD2_57_9]|nr:MAG: hypothetical protein A2010_13305 [Nitrospirae bacterium GWD2_57_9]